MTNEEKLVCARCDHSFEAESIVIKNGERITVAEYLRRLRLADAVPVCDHCVDKDEL